MYVEPGVTIGSLLNLVMLITIAAGLYRTTRRMSRMVVDYNENMIRKIEETQQNTTELISIAKQIADQKSHIDLLSKRLVEMQPLTRIKKP